MHPLCQKLHVSNVKALKQQLRIYGCNPFAEVNARDITAREELPKDIIENLLTVLGMKNVSILSPKECWKEQKGFFEQIAKLQIALGIKSKKKTPMRIAVIKEDRQAFGVILVNEIDLIEALKYPITSISLSIENPDGTLRQSPKNTFWNFLNTGIPSPFSLFVTHTVQLLAIVVRAKKGENLVSVFIWKVNIKT